MSHAPFPLSHPCSRGRPLLWREAAGGVRTGGPARRGATRGRSRCVRLGLLACVLACLPLKSPLPSRPPHSQDCPQTVWRRVSRVCAVRGKGASHALIRGAVCMPPHHACVRTCAVTCYYRAVASRLDDTDRADGEYGWHGGIPGVRMGSTSDRDGGTPHDESSRMRAHVSETGTERWVWHASHCICLARGRDCACGTAGHQAPPRSASCCFIRPPCCCTARRAAAMRHSSSASL